MSGVLILDAANLALIRAAVELARARPTPWMPELVDADQDTVLTVLKDRKPGITGLRQQYPSQHLKLGTYHAAFSFEYQPAGLFRHLSVSSQARGKVPGMEVLAMLLPEFGFSGFPLTRPGRVWMEEYERKRHAVNVVELVMEELQ